MVDAIKSTVNRLRLLRAVQLRVVWRKTLEARLFLRLLQTR